MCHTYTNIGKYKCTHTLTCTYIDVVLLRGEIDGIEVKERLNDCNLLLLRNLLQSVKNARKRDVRNEVKEYPAQVR